MLAFDIFKNKIHGKEVLEIGCADGIMSEQLVKYTKYLDIVEPSKNYYQLVKKNIKDIRNFFNCFLEELETNNKYDVILCAGIIHHIENPKNFLKVVGGFLNPNGVILATVPNITSLHRRIGVRMGLLKDEYGDSERNKKFHQFGRYDIDKFKTLFIDSGFKILEYYGYMIKPFSSEIMARIKLNNKQIKAMFEIGKEFQNISSQIFVAAKKYND